MATRARQSTATPGPGRVSSGGAALPRYEPPAFSLNPNAQRALADLTAKLKLKKLDEKLDVAKIAVAESAGEINDRLTYKEEAAKKRKRAQPTSSQDGDVAEVDAAQASLDEYRDKVDRMTERMDMSMRKIIDGKQSVLQIKESIAATALDARANASTQASAFDVRSQRRPRVSTNDDDEEEEEYEDFEPTDPTRTQAPPCAIDTFRKKLDDEKTRYQSYSLTDRYANDNDYRDFRRVVHDARHPDGDVTMPHHSEWFPEGDAPAPGITKIVAANADDDDDDDIAVARTAISTKCPLTLQEFKKPLTSKKCPHSFESEPILQMIASSHQRLNGAPGARGAVVGGEKAVQCPVAGCSETLTKDDLAPDAVLIRKIQRIQRAKAMEDEADDEGDGRGATQRNATVIESDGIEEEEDVDRVIQRQTQQQIKKEKARSGVVASTPAPRGTAPTNTAAVELMDSSGDSETDDG